VAGGRELVGLKGMSSLRIIQFSHILGQEKAKRIVQQAVLSGRVPHAYLFTGITGVGKTSLATAMAASLNCKSRKGVEACGKCSSCRQISSGNFPDFSLISPEGGAIKIRQIREAQDSMRFAPMAGPYRVVILDQAETMTDEAANAFLKTLEEPPKGNVLVLNAVEPANLLPTIVSRCQRVPFVPLATEQIVDYLVNETGMQGEKAVVLAKVAEGSLGRAIAMAQSDFLEQREKWLKKAMKIPELNAAAAFDMALELSGEKGADVEQGSKYEVGGLLDLLGVLAMWYRDLLLLKTGGAQSLLVNADLLGELKSFARKFKLLQIYESLLILDQAQRDIRMRRNKALVLEKMVLSLRDLARSSTQIS